MPPTPPEALLITGAYGTGKSLLAASIGDELERRSVRFAALDLDWLSWFDPGDDPTNEQRIFLANLRAVARNYRDISIPWYVLAGSVGGKAELAALAEAIAMPVRVLRLTAPIDVIEHRLRSDFRPGDLPTALEQVTTDFAASIADRTLANTAPIADVATEVLDWLGWR